MSSPPKPPALDPETRRALAAGLYNRTWELMSTADRTPALDDEMLHAAHASRHHWGEVGRSVNLARGEWLCARVYSVLGRGEPALWHATRCLAIHEADEAAEGREDWDLAAAYEGLARASAVAGDAAGRDAWVARAREAVAAIADADDRAVIEGDLDTLERLIGEVKPLVDRG